LVGLRNQSGEARPAAGQSAAAIIYQSRQPNELMLHSEKEEEEEGGAGKWKGVLKITVHSLL